MLKGCFTALVTPFTMNDEVDKKGLNQLIDFQITNGISGIVAVGTTGESPTLTWNEHNRVIEHIAKGTKNKCICIAGTGSNNTKEAIEATQHAKDFGVDAVLLMDPYYNGPSSLEIRKEYFEPIAKIFPDVQIVPYIIPGRTGTQMLPEDLAILSAEYKNIKTVKEATGDLENIKRTRVCCGDDFSILSGDDSLTYQMITDSKIKANGAISVVSNVFPYSVSKMIEFLNQGKIDEAKKLELSLNEIFNLVTVKTKELTPYGEVVCRARNPLGIKTLMSILGMPSGHCRRPLGKMTKKGFELVLEAARKLFIKSPEFFKPISEFFCIDIEDRFNNPNNWQNLFYNELN